MARDPEYDVTLDGVGYILTRDGLGVSRVQANPYAMKSSSGERTYADLDEWAVFQVSSCHRGMGQERYGDPEQFWWAASIDTRFKGKIFLGPKETGVYGTTMGIVGDIFFAGFDSTLYCAVDDTVYEDSGSAWTSRDEVTDEDVYEMCVFNDYLYVARGGNSMRKSIDGTTWTDVGGTPAAYDLYVHGGFLYRSTGYTLYYSSDPEAASPTWSTGITVGDSSQPIRSLVTYQNSLIVFKTDGAWRIPGNPGDLDVAYRVPELDWRQAVHTNNGMSSTVWVDGFLYVVTNDMGILRWTGRTVTPIGPDTLLLDGQVGGTITRLISTPNFLYIATASDTNVRKGWILAWNGSGWHVVHNDTSQKYTNLHYFDGYLYTGKVYISTGDRFITKTYLPTETQDPTQATGYLYGSATQNIYFSAFTANLHGTQKELRSVTIWVDDAGSGTDAGGNRYIVFYYAVDCETYIECPPTFNTKNGAKIWEIDFTPPSITDKLIASVGANKDTITLATGYDASDLSTNDWVYVVDTNEYRYVISWASGPPVVLTLSSPLDNTPAANTWLRPGVPTGRYILLRLSMSTGEDDYTPVVRAIALKYLVNIKDYDIWQLNVQVSDSLTLRNGNIKRQPIADQLSRLDEIRKKGRVTFIDEMGDTQTIKVTNYSLQPVRQRTDSKMEAETEYTCKLTLLEV